MTEEKKPPAALVIGAGIAGIQAALDIGNAGFELIAILVAAAHAVAVMSGDMDRHSLQRNPQGLRI